MSEDSWGPVRAKLKAKVIEQINRHRAVDPNTNAKKMVELQIRLEKETFQKRLKRIEDGEVEDQDGSRELMLRVIIDHVLPEVEQQLKRQF